jgi:hypothetical protein
MELDDLKGKWAEYDRKLDTSIRLNAAVLRASGLDRAGSALAGLSRALVFEIVANAVVVVLLGSFIGSNLGQARFLVPAAILDVFALALIQVGIRQWVALRAIDWSAPVVAIQKRLESLRIGRIRTTKWVLLLSPLLWTPLLVVSQRAFFGVDAFAVLDATWLAANVLFSVVFILVVMWVSGRHADQWRNSPLVRRLMDDVAGRSLTRARGFLEAVARFDGDERTA